MVVKKVSISVDENTYVAVRSAVESGAFRNMSHLFEEGAKKMLRELEEKGQGPCEALA
jgi:Arc/MetJ-type ribon-helix-helix transcriptional regulator